MKSSLRNLLEVLGKRVALAEHEAVPDERLTPSIAAVLAAIVHVGRREGIGGIARLLEVQQSYATRAVQQLEELGFVHRVIRDGSQLHSILLTMEGAEAVARLNAVDGYVETSVLGALAEGERVVLLALLQKAALAPEIPAVVEEVAQGGGAVIVAAVVGGATIEG